MLHHRRPPAPVRMRRRIRRGYRRLSAARIPLADSSRRLRVALVAVAIALSLCGGRLLQLQGFDSSAYAALSADQLTRTLPLLPSRGEITDRNGVVLASTQAAVAITADPTLTAKNADRIADIILKYLSADRAQLVAQLTKTGTRFVYLKKKVPALTYAAIAAELADQKPAIPGVYREADPIRTYPAGSVAASVIGFVNAEGAGVTGLERSFNHELAGTEGTETYESAPNGNRIPLGGSKVTPATNGVNLQTTIDSELQWVVEQAVAGRVRSSEANSGFGIVVDIKTGEVLALANYPTFDAGDPGGTAAANRRNRAVEEVYEPGSVEKILTSAAILDSGTTVGGHKITPDTKVAVPPYLYYKGGRIKDHWSHPEPELKLLMRGVVARSSNIGTALLARQVDKATLAGYLRSFGLGSPTGIELPAEASGYLPGADMLDATRDQIAFGQGLSVNGVQEAAALAGLVNGGLYHPPTLVRSATDADGHAVELPTRPARQIVSPQTSKQIRDLMLAVTDHNKSLRIKGYETIGKTGTAQNFNAKCHCYRANDYTVSYVGVAPLNDPSILVYVVVKHPRHGQNGSGVAGPAVKEILQYALPRYSFAPAPTTHKVLPIVW